MNTTDALVTRLLDTSALRVPAIPDWLRADLVLAAETIIALRKRPAAELPAGWVDSRGRPL